MLYAENQEVYVITYRKAKEGKKKQESLGIGAETPGLNCQCSAIANPLYVLHRWYSMPHSYSWNVIVRDGCCPVIVAQWTALAAQAKCLVFGSQ